MRHFNTSGPNFPHLHYTLMREELIQRGMDLIQADKYFTIWAPRQTGKSTYFLMLQEKLQTQGYRVVQMNVENFQSSTLETLLRSLTYAFEKTQIELPKTMKNLADFSNYIQYELKSVKLVFILDEVEGINASLLGEFLHTIRNMYHYRAQHCLKSVILVGVSNIVGIVQDNASPFNVTENLSIPYFTNTETIDLLQQHEQETGQRFAPEVIQKISEITANQPGLVNGFADQLVTRNPKKAVIEYSDYLQVEQWYLMEAIDKNFSNILNKAKEFRPFLESLLFTEIETPFDIDREAIKVLHTNGLLKKNEQGNVEFWVPFYKKRLQKAFYPYTNGEQSRIVGSMYTPDFFTPNGRLNLDFLIETYKAYVKRRGFGVFREKDEQGKFTSIKEAGLIYSFETFIAAFISEAGGTSYREADAGLGKTDLIINVQNNELLIETKKYYSPSKFEKGKKQLAYYASRLGLAQAVYLVFTPHHLKYPPTVLENQETIEGVLVLTYLVGYDEEKDFGE
jgi:hypothetical protein